MLCCALFIIAFRTLLPVICIVVLLLEGMRLCVLCVAASTLLLVVGAVAFLCEAVRRFTAYSGATGISTLVPMV